MPDDTQREKRNREAELEAELMVIIAGYMLVDEGQRDAYVEARRDLVRRARAFEGCIDLAITADPVDRRRVNNLEVWASAEVLNAGRAEANPPQIGIEPADMHMRRFYAEDGGPLF
jgi:quinol monooxygenase YgiN